jgi:hypothetical protein
MLCRQLFLTMYILHTYILLKNLLRFDVKAKNLCQFEKFVFTITTKRLNAPIYGERGKNSVAAADVYKRW